MDLDIIYVHIYLSIGPFYILAIINNATMNTGIYMSSELEFWMSFGKYPEVEVLGRKVVQFLLW